MQARGATILVISALVAVGAGLLVAKADGNVTAYVVGGALLAIMLYIIASTVINWTKATAGKDPPAASPSTANAGTTPPRAASPSRTT
ncbi:hypothetical protein [Micromonospora sp. WMMD737]|uniref:hypothetical protein n=1 Tax=Micromonospora sp. WMMD737 TaxID=3404113 RepID=UPI003B9379F4